MSPIKCLPLPCPQGARPLRVPQSLAFLVTPLRGTGVGHLPTRCCLLHPWVASVLTQVVEEEGNKRGPILVSVIFFTLVGGHMCLFVPTKFMGNQGEV